MDFSSRRKWNDTRFQISISESCSGMSATGLITGCCMTHPQVIPNSVRGAVLGFAARAPSNSGALSVSFGSSGIPLALGRLFKRVMFIK